MGGGVAGLVTAFELRSRLGGDVAITLLERTSRLGGKVDAAAVGDFEVEQGADSFLVRDPSALSLCRRLGIDDLEEPAVFGATVWLDGRVRPLPSKTIAGIPCSPWATWRSGFVSARGAARMLADLALPGSLSSQDISIGSLVRRRLGDEALRHVTDPLLAGSRAGDPDRMSLAAAARELDGVARRHRSLIRGLRVAARRGEVTSGVPQFRAPVGGMKRLVESLHRALHDVDVRTSTKAERILTGPGGVRIELAGGRQIEADAVVLAVPAFEAGELLASGLPAAARALTSIPYASLAVVTLVFPTGPARELRGSGMLVPGDAGRVLSACTWYSRKWPSRAGGAGEFIVRGVVGRAARHPALDWEDSDLVGAVGRELAESVGLATVPKVAHVHRWERALPEYRVGHPDLVRTIDQELAREPRLAIAGAALEGSGIPDCINSALRAAERVAEGLADHGPRR